MGWEQEGLLIRVLLLQLYLGVKVRGGLPPLQVALTTHDHEDDIIVEDYNPPYTPRGDWWGRIRRGC